jgi:branched-chain amino acid transport system substrate-binding protein
VLVLALGAFALLGGSDADAACKAPGGYGTREKPVRVYSSLPIGGQLGKQTQAVDSGAKMALADARSKAGGCVVRYVSLNAAVPDGDGFSYADKVEENATRVARDRSALAYIGDFESEATRSSLPVLNEAGVAQISPSNDDPALTVSAPGAGRGEPGNHYPSGRRTYARLYPSAVAEAADIAVLMRNLACDDGYVIDDGYDRDASLAQMVVSFAKQTHFPVVGGRTVLNNQSSYAGDIAAIAKKRPGCIVLSIAGGQDPRPTAKLFNGLNKRLANAWLIGADQLFVSDFAAKLTPEAKLKTLVMSAPAPRGAYPAAGLAFFRRFLARYGADSYDPFAVYGYESMALALDAIKRAGDEPTRAKVVKALLGTRNRRSVLGTYSIDKNGDTTLSGYALFKPVGTDFQFDRVVSAPGSLRTP